MTSILIATLINYLFNGSLIVFHQILIEQKIIENVNQKWIYLLLIIPGIGFIASLILVIWFKLLNRKN